MTQLNAHTALRPGGPSTSTSLRSPAADDRSSTAARFLDSLLGFVRELDRAVLFGPGLDGQLGPLASVTRPGHGSTFYIRKDMLKSAYRERQRQVGARSGSTGILAAIPIVAGASGECFILHAELDLRGDASQQPNAALERLQAAVRFGSPVFAAEALVAHANDWAMAMARILTAAVDAKDTYTSGHSERVAKYSLVLADAYGLEPAQKPMLQLSALLHDIGKIGINDAILRKPGLLSTEEFEEMKGHPLLGVGIIEFAPCADSVLGGIKYHHERFDGTGYPDGLQGEAIPLFGRIVAIADAFDAMTSGRSYSGFMSTEIAIESLATKDDLFDPELLKALVRAYENGSFSMRTGTRLGKPMAS